MNTPSPISNVSRCLKPTPLPTCRPCPQRLAHGAPDGPAHQSRRSRRRRPRTGRRARSGPGGPYFARSVSARPTSKSGSRFDLLATVNRRNDARSRHRHRLDTGRPVARPQRPSRPESAVISGNIGSDSTSSAAASECGKVAVRVAEITMRLLQVHRDGIVEARSARRPPAAARCSASRSADAHRVDVIDVPAVRRLDRESDARFAGEHAVVVARALAPARLGPPLEVSELHPQDGALQCRPSGS